MTLHDVIGESYRDSRGSLQKTRRFVIRRMRWRGDEWYQHVDEIMATLVVLIGASKTSP